MRKLLSASEQEERWIIRKGEGLTLFWIGYLHMLLPFAVLLPLALLWPLLPDALFSSDWILHIDIWWRNLIPRLAVEGAAFDRMSSFWGTKYVAFHAMCWSLVAIINIFLMGPVVILTWKRGWPLISENRKFLWRLPLGIAFFGYGALGRWLRIEDPNPGHLEVLVGRTWLVYLIVAGDIAALQFAVSGFAIVVTKALKFRDT